MAPEHRLSLQLKRHELWAQGAQRAPDCDALDYVAGLPYLDLLDESDELLHHRSVAGAVRMVRHTGSRLAVTKLYSCLLTGRDNLGIQQIHHTDPAYLRQNV